MDIYILCSMKIYYSKIAGSLYIWFIQQFEFNT